MKEPSLPAGIAFEPECHFAGPGNMQAHRRWLHFIISNTEVRYPRPPRGIGSHRLHNACSDVAHLHLRIDYRSTRLSAKVPRIVAVLACPHAADGAITIIIATMALGTKKPYQSVPSHWVTSPHPSLTQAPPACLAQAPPACWFYASFAARNLVLI